MKIISFNIANFRRLYNVQIDIANEKTIFVGANNSGKTSASYALKYFLSHDGKRHLKINDITLINHQKINDIGEKWLKYNEKNVVDEDIQKSYIDFTSCFPFLDILINVPEDEIHHVIKIIPTLDWKYGLLGIRLSYEPNDIEKLKQEFIHERLCVQDKEITLWPCDLIDFLSRRMDSLFKINTYLLDIDPESKQVKNKSDFIVQGFNVHDLIKFDFISAQREISDESEKTNDIEKPASQIRQYYDRIINPEKSPSDEDIATLRITQDAQECFNKTLECDLEPLFTEIKTLGYPNITDPDIIIKTQIGLLSSYINHSSVLNYKVNELSLPENYLGLGYQNLIAMTVKLIKHRDEWLRVGKTSHTEKQIERLHFVIIEEPEAHLHVQAQQVFINNSYNLLTRYKNTDDIKIKELYKNIDPALRSQLLVTTHSSHIVYEVDFASLRYFDRFFSETSCIPLTQVKNLSNYFNSEDESRRFAARYLKLNHCDIFFADALVMLEGKVEKILVPYLIKEHFKDLYRRYISYIEIEGDYVHIFSPLIEMLGINTLIITDLDSTETNRKKTIPKRGCNQISSNPVINNWLFKGSEAKKSIDELVDMKKEDLIKSIDHAEIYFAYQQERPINLSTKINGIDKDLIGDIIPRTFEDALIVDNLKLISKLSSGSEIGKLPTTESQIKKVIDDLTDCSSLEHFMQFLHSRLNPKDKENKCEGRGEIKKASLALELLFICDQDKQLFTPQYITKGLEWLQGRMDEKEPKNQGVQNEQ